MGDEGWQHGSEVEYAYFRRSSGTGRNEALVASARYFIEVGMPCAYIHYTVASVVWLREVEFAQGIFSSPNGY